MVIDASVALKWFVEEDLVEQAMSLLRNPDRFRAPDLIVPEFTNALWKKVARGQITQPQAQGIAAAIQRIRLRLVLSGTLHRRALDIAIELRHPVYDCLYIACAELNSDTFVTADQKLSRVVRESEFSRLVRHLSEIAL